MQKQDELHCQAVLEGVGMLQNKDKALEDVINTIFQTRGK